MLEFVYDRTESDVAQWADWRARGYVNLTAEEQAEWDAGLKGAYNVSDVNRVEYNLRVLSEVFRKRGYTSFHFYNWQWDRLGMVSSGRLPEWHRAIVALRNAVIFPSGIPDAPDSLAHMTYQIANDIEHILFGAQAIDKTAAKTVRYCGTFNSGEEVLF